MRYRVRHSSAYRYGSDIMLAHHLLHLSPRASRRGSGILKFRMDVEPKPSVIAEHQDYFGNPMTYIEMHEPHKKLVVRTDIDIEVDEDRPGVAAMDTPWEALRDQLNDPVDAGPRAASAFAYISPKIAPSADLHDYALPSFKPGRPIGEAAMDLTNRINDEFTFDPEATTISTPVAEVLAERRGVCRTSPICRSAACARSGWPRAMSAAICAPCRCRENRAPSAPTFPHAWLSVWCGGDLWLDMDPTNGRAGSSDLITLAWGRDYGDVSPLQGVIIGSSIQHMTVEVDVENL